MTEADWVIYGTLITLTVVVTLMSRWALRNARASEATAKTWTAEQVQRLAAPLLLDGPWIWGCWFGRAGISGLSLDLQTAQGQALCRIESPTLPRQGVRRHFELEGQRYECVSAGAFSSRSLLRVAGSGQVVLRGHHGLLRTRIERESGGEPVCELRLRSVFHRYSPLMRGEEEVGRLFIVDEGQARPWCSV